uniref:Uncharacterized protein n=1 Tax=Anguilla anguilla TaxID=7936 RepID=A0A0E9Q7E5_ANGAN
MFRHCCAFLIRYGNDACTCVFLLTQATALPGYSANKV